MFATIHTTLKYPQFSRDEADRFIDSSVEAIIESVEEDHLLAAAQKVIDRLMRGVVVVDAWISRGEDSMEEVF